MKSFIFACALTLSLNASAADLCGKYMPCGVYEGHGSNLKSDGTLENPTQFTERITISSADEHSMVLEDLLYMEGQKPEDAYNIKMDVSFQENGVYTATLKGEFFAVGVCNESVCTFNFVPFKQPVGVTGNVNILRFENDKLERSMLASVKLGTFLRQQSELSKK